MIEKAAAYATGGGSGAAIVGSGLRIFGLSVDEWTIVCMVGGLLVGIAGLAIKTLFDYLRFRRGD